MMKVLLLICLFLSFVVCDDFHTQCMDGFDANLGPLQDARCKKAAELLSHHHDPFLKPYFAKLENDIGKLTVEFLELLKDLLKHVSGLEGKSVPGPMGKVGECDKASFAVPGPMGKAGECDKASFEKWMQEREEKEQFKTLEMRGKIEEKK